MERGRGASAANALRPLLDIRELSRILGVAPKTIYRWAEEGTGPPALKVGRLLRWDPATVHRWIQAQQTSASQEFASP